MRCAALPGIVMRLGLALVVTGPLGAQEKPEEEASQSSNLPPVHTSITIQSTLLQPTIDLRNSEIFDKTLFSRDDQVFHQLASGINIGQHEGGGKSIEVRRFGFNLDHGGVNGGLKVLVDNIQQNQTTQGHGQGYLGALKGLTPELIQETQVVNGPFSAEYGDFSGLGVVHIKLRESLPDQWTARVQGGSFNSKRGFLSYSPDKPNTDAFLAYEGSRSDGPFLKPLGYARDNATGNWTSRRGDHRAFGLRTSASRNDYASSGQIPLSEVSTGRLDRFGFLDPGEGGRIRSGALAGYFRQEQSSGAQLKIDGFVARSLFDLYSNFTYFLNDPENGDGIQQHDSRLQQGANLQYLRPSRFAGGSNLFVAGSNLHWNQINVGLYSRVNRDPTAVLTAANANVLNSSGYAQNTLSLLNGRLIAGAGLRYDLFRFDVTDRVEQGHATQNTGRFQPKLSLAVSPTWRLPLTIHANYGRGISSLDARSILTAKDRTKIATTDFFQLGVAASWQRLSLVVDGFWIDRSNELVYIADDGSLEFQGPSRAYGFESKLSLALTRHLSLHGGVTKVSNAFYRGTEPKVYVDRAPHFVSDAGFTLAGWRGWTGSLRMRAINRYRLDGEDPSILAAGHTVFDFSVIRRINRRVDFNFAIDNLGNRAYWETQNYLESRPFRGGPALASIHATPGCPRTFTAGLTFRFGAK